VTTVLFPTLLFFLLLFLPSLDSLTDTPAGWGTYILSMEKTLYQAVL
jgi:hypothetical protein